MGNIQLGSAPNVHLVIFALILCDITWQKHPEKTKRENYMTLLWKNLHAREIPLTTSNIGQMPPILYANNTTNVGRHCCKKSKTVRITPLIPNTKTKTTYRNIIALLTSNINTNINSIQHKPMNKSQIHIYII